MRRIINGLLCAAALAGFVSCASREPGPAERIGKGIDEIAKGLGDWSDRQEPRGYDRRYDDRRYDRSYSRDGVPFEDRDGDGRDDYFDEDYEERRRLEADRYGDDYGSGGTGDARRDYYDRERY